MRHDKFDWSGYFEWLVSFTDDREHEDMLPVLSYLWRKEFDWSGLNSLDRNRAMDGVQQREEYAEEFNCIIKEEDLEEPCTLLEMFVRLSRDIENNVTGVPGKERPDIWFWRFLKNLGIDERCTGKGYSKHYLDQVVDKWLKGGITKHGKNSPFPVRYCDGDMRQKDIWMCAMAYVNDVMRYW